MAHELDPVADRGPFRFAAIDIALCELFPVGLRRLDAGLIGLSPDDGHGGAAVVGARELARRD